MVTIPMYNRRDNDDVFPFVGPPIGGGDQVGVKVSFVNAHGLERRDVGI